MELFMRFKKTTLAALCLAFASAAAYAAAGDRFFSNPTSNKDVVIQVNKAGVTTDVIKAVGSTGAVTVDISGSTNIHTLFGRTLLLNDVNNSGDPGITLRAKSTAGSTENYSINVDATDNSNKGLYFDSPQGKIFFRGTSSATTGSVTGAGVWTLGPSSLGSAHAINGGISIKGGPSIRQMAPQTGAINADGGNGFVNFSFSIAVLDTAKTSCTANIKDGSGSYLGAAIACDMVDSFSCRCRVTGRTSGTVQALLMEWY